MLPLKFFRHADLGGANMEKTFFVRRKGRFELDGPWPPDDAEAAQPLDRLWAVLSKNLWNPDIRFDDSVQNPPFRIHHYACHCDTTDDDPKKHCIMLKGNEYNDFTITLDELYESLAAAMGNNPGPPARPFVFLNACGSAAVVPSGSLSFPGFFTRNSFVGFIGTETPIPDQWAASFSETFYKLLLDGETVGEAAYRAKWLLLQREENPSGIFYVLYGDPFMQFVPRSDP